MSIELVMPANHLILCRPLFLLSSVFPSTGTCTENRNRVIRNPVLIVQMVKNLSALQESQVLFLGWEDPLEKEMATPSNILAWRILWTEEPGWLQSMGLQELDST